MAPSAQRKKTSRSLKGRSQSSVSRRNSVSRQRTPLIPLTRPSLASQPPAQRRRLTEAADNTPADRPLHTPSASSQDGFLPAADDEDSRNDELDHIVVAIDSMDRGKVGCAYYVTREESMFCMEDVAHGGLEIVEALEVELRPTIVLLPLRVDTGTNQRGVFQHTRESLVHGAEEHLHLPYQLDYRPNKEFSYEGAKNKLVNLSNMNPSPVSFLVPGDSVEYDELAALNSYQSTGRQGELLRISGCIDLDNKMSVGCVGAILTYLQRKRGSEYLQDDPDAQRAYQVTNMEMFSLKDTMFINSDTLLSLQIIQPESHPNAFNQGPCSTGSKESLSVYGLFQHLARTPQGRTRLRGYFLRPSLDLDEINARHDFLSVFTRPDNILATQKLSKSMSKIKNMRLTMIQLRKGINGANQKFGGFKSGVWATLLEFAFHTLEIKDTLREVNGGQSLALYIRAMEILDTFQLQRIGKTVSHVVDLDSSIEQHRTVIKRGIDDELDRIKDVYDSMDQLLSRTAVDISRTIPPEVDVSINVIYFPQLGFHITVPINELTGQPVYEGNDPPWERTFTTQSQVYFKDRRMHEMDEQLGDLYAMICDIEIDLSYDLAQRVLRDEKMLIAISDVCGELDTLLALALGASQYKLTRPRMSDENIINIKAGRHLLQEMSVGSYVTNDAYLIGGSGLRHCERSMTVTSESTSDDTPEPDGPSMLLLTGPNYSGKSVYMKQVALIAYMAQIGSFVPAESATLGLTDKLLTRITTRETVSKAQSAFMLDLQQIALALNHATPHSLLIIDEFGKGTDSCDGAGLAAGVFNHLLARGGATASPKVLAATHFHELFEHRFLLPHPNLALAHMQVLVDRAPSAPPESQVTYLYNLCAGRSALSYGMQCAAMNGVPAAVVARANQLAGLAARGEDLVSLCAAMGRAEERDLRDAEAVARRFLAVDFDGVEGEVEMVLTSILDVAEAEESETGVEERGSTGTRS